MKKCALTSLISRPKRSRRGEIRTSPLCWSSSLKSIVIDVTFLSDAEEPFCVVNNSNEENLFGVVEKICGFGTRLVVFEDQVLRTNRLRVKSVEPDLDNLGVEEDYAIETEPIEPPSLVLDVWETLYLLKQGHVRVFEKNEELLEPQNVIDNLLTEDRVSKFVVYNHFRKEGWVVRDGFGFGVDFLLYKCGPDYYHALFAVKIGSKLSWTELLGLNRIVEAAAKNLLLVRVKKKPELDKIDAANLDECTVETLLVQRFANRSANDGQDMCNSDSSDFSEVDDS